MYGEDLAYIHEQGYSSEARQAASFILRLLRSAGIRDGHLVDFGCGSGHSSAVFARAGYTVIGIDRSSPMVCLAKQQAPDATFMVGSFLILSDTQLDAIIAIGEVVNYLPSCQSIRRLMRLAFSTLRPSGLLVFDIRTIPPAGQPREWITGRTGKDCPAIAASCIASKRPRLKVMKTEREESQPSISEAAGAVRATSAIA